MFESGLKTQTNLFLVTSRIFYYQKKKKKIEIATQLNLALLQWDLVEFTAVQCSRHCSRVSSRVSQITIADLLRQGHSRALGVPYRAWGAR